MLYVLFATRNGAKTLPAMLDSLQNVLEPEGGCQIVAADNASTDSTRAILDKYSGELALTILSEPIPGKANALNRALDGLGRRAALAELIVFTDDDILADPEWLIRLQRAARANPQAALFGGRIELALPCVVPAWIYDYSACFGVLFGTRAHPGGPCNPAQLHGANLAIRGQAFANGIRFNPQFGPDGTHDFPAGCDADLTQRLHRAGHLASFVSRACVRRRILAQQLCEDWVLAQARCAGRGHGLRGDGGRRAKQRGALPLTLRAGYRLTQALAIASRLAGQDKWRRSCAFAAAWHAGAMEGAAARLAREDAAGPLRAPVLAGPALASIGGFM